MADTLDASSLSLSEATASLTAPGQLFEVGEESVFGRQIKVWKNCPPSLRTVLELSRGHGDLTYLVYEDERVTFAEHFEKVCAFSTALVERFGVRKGDRVAIAMRNVPEWVIAFWSAAAVGAIVVPLNAWWTGPELVYGLEDSGSTVVVVDPERLERLQPHLGRLLGGSLRHVLLARGAEAPAAKRDESPPSSMDEALKSFASRSGALPPASIEPDDEATIFYTSGTTAEPKGVLGTHRNICSNLMAIAFLNARGQLTASKEFRERTSTGGKQNSHLLSVPLFHANGCHAILLANTAVGGKLVMMRRFDPSRALELIEREQVTTFGGVPTMVLRVIDSPDFATRDTSSVRTVAYGGAPAPPVLLRRIAEHFPSGRASNGYGLTETSSVTTLNAGEDYLRKPDSVGPPLPVVELRFVSPAGEDVAEGETGELWVRGPNVVPGYWHKPEATAASFVDGWLRTGDLARRDEEGFVYIVDRAKDLVIRGGENVSSSEVEAAICEHPAVVEAAVIGIPHEVLGEEVGAVVVRRTGHPLTQDELRAHVGQRLAAFKVPTRIWFAESELPRNPAGKVLKRELREKLVTT